MKLHRTKFQEKFNEALKAVLPIIGIVLVLCFTVAPISPSILMAFLIGAVLLIVGMMLFTLGVELSMTPMGERVGTCMTQSKKLSVMIILSFILGVVITISEPDLQVLAEQVPSIPNLTLIFAVAFGVGIFLVVALLRMLFGIPLSYMLVFFYGLVIALAFFVPKSFLSVAFDAGGVTTGPMTVPFIMAMGVGIAAIRSDKHAADDSFGLVSLCSIGPILSVLVLGLIYHPESTEYIPERIPDINSSVELWGLFAEGFPKYMWEMAVSLFPILVFFGIFQIIFRGIQKRTLIKIGIGLVYICGAVPFSDGSECRIYAGRKLFGTGDRIKSLPMDYRPGGHADRLFYCSGGTCCLCADQTGRGYYFRRNIGKGYEP